jgi:hypothetical protein
VLPLGQPEAPFRATAFEVQVSFELPRVHSTGTGTGTGTGTSSVAWDVGVQVLDNGGGDSGSSGGSGGSGGREFTRVGVRSATWLPVRY